MAKVEVKLSVLDATGGLAKQAFTLEEIESFGLESDDFYSTSVVCSFRVRYENQVFPLRVWFRRDEVAEDQWPTHARKLAAEMIMRTNEVLNKP